jgi:effector-binding domain-containing protein
MEYRTEDIVAQPVVYIETDVTQAEVGERVGALLGELMPMVGDNVSGAPLARWKEWDGEAGTMQVAVPVKSEMAGSGRLEAGELPAGRALIATYVGPYDGLAAAWGEVHAKMEADGLEGCAAPWEQYVSDCATTPAEELQTIIVWPIAGD